MGVGLESGNRNVVAEIDVLDIVEELNAFFHRTLKGFATGNEAGAAGAFVDHGGANGFGKIAFS